MGHRTDTEIMKREHPNGPCLEGKWRRLERHPDPRRVAGNTSDEAKECFAILWGACDLAGVFASQAADALTPPEEGPK